MAASHEVKLHPALEQSVAGWNDDDKITLLAFIELLEEFGFDLLVNASVRDAGWLTVEYIEPGETPAMLWARVFVDLDIGNIGLRVSGGGDVIHIESS